jgi:hypothetical protein
MKNHFRGQAPQLLLLLGALAFSLSTLPEGQKKSTLTFTVTSLSSNAEFASTCADMVNSLDAGANDGSCDIRPVTRSSDYGNIQGQVDVKLTDVAHRGQPTTKEWVYTLKVLCQGEDCPENAVISTPGHVAEKDFAAITAKVMSEFSTDASRMADQIKAERKKQARINKCEINDDGDKLAGKAQMKCKVARLDKLNDDQAADYYQDNILPDLERMVGSNNIRDQREGAALLKQLKKSGAGGDFVADSIDDLAKFGGFNYQANQLRQQWMMMSPNDPNRNLIRQQALSNKMMADSFFQARTDQVGIDNWGMGMNGFDFGSNLSNNLADFQSHIDENYAPLLALQKQLIQNTSFQAAKAQNPQFQMQQNNDPRDARAPVSTSLPGPTTPWSKDTQFGSSTQPTPPAAPNKAMPAPSKASNSNIPKSGAPVR